MAHRVYNTLGHRLIGNSMMLYVWDMKMAVMLTAKQTMHTFTHTSHYW